MPRLLVFGGSQGASSINRAAIELARTLAPRGETRFHILAGPRHFEAVVRSLAGVEGVRVEAYSEDMASAYGEADLALCRAGALTIAELALFGLPAILIPYPHAADDHQRRNAEEVVAADGALLIPDERLGEPEALEAIGSLLRDPGRRAAMARGARSLAHPDAAGRIAEAIRTLAGWTGRAAGGISLAAAL